MILNPKESTVAYRCPHCGTNVMSVVGIFALTGDLIKLKCSSCGHSELTLTYTSDGSIRINVPCVACPKPHNYVISSNVFFEKDIFVLSCSYTAIDICFIGQKDKVMAELKRSDEELERMLVEAGLDDFDSFHSHNRGHGGEDDAEEDDDKSQKYNDFNDMLVEDVIRLIVAELKEDNAIYCQCRGQGDYSFIVNGGSVIVYCKKCGCYHDYPINSLSTAESFLESNELVLDKKT